MQASSSRLHVAGTLAPTTDVTDDDVQFVLDNCDRDQDGVRNVQWAEGRVGLGGE